MSAYLQFILYKTLDCSLHSEIASPWIKNWLNCRMNFRGALLRAVYNLFDKIFVLEDKIWLKRRRVYTILEN